MLPDSVYSLPGQFNETGLKSDSSILQFVGNRGKDRRGGNAEKQKKRSRSDRGGGANVVADEDGSPAGSSDSGRGGGANVVADTE